ncbi:MAG: hypothetical protein P8J37_22995 [Fuerstiella sp.]|nr:hypothetical protein [Fuerstiella sp.]
MLNTTFPIQSAAANIAVHGTTQQHTATENRASPIEINDWANGAIRFD